MNKKIGIITYWYSKNNYGQILQCFALQNVLKTMGYYPFLIRFIPSYSLLFRVRRKLHTRKKTVLSTNTKNDDDARCFDSFIDTYINQSENVYHSYHQLRNNPPEAYAYICGSDQIWNEPLDNPDTAAWFLRFGNALKISYGPSILKDVSFANKRRLKKYLSTIDYLSVREVVGKDLLRELGFNDVMVVADPTLLLKGNDYVSLLRFNCKDYNYKKDYIFCYYVNVDSVEQIHWTSIQKFASDNNLDLKVTLSSGFLSSLRMKESIGSDSVTIEEWLFRISSSKYVITSSYHGVLFSLLFHKQFVVMPLNDASIQSNNRLLPLLKYLNLNNRFYDGDFSIILKAIDWDYIDAKISMLREKSLAFLKKALLGKKYRGFK